MTIGELNPAERFDRWRGTGPGGGRCTLRALHDKDMSAMAGSNYDRGAMEIDDHKETFSGFMNMSVYGGASIIVALLFPILVFGVNLSWLTALIVTVVLGVIIGVVMKFKAQWYAILIGVSVLLAVIVGLLTLIF